MATTYEVCENHVRDFLNSSFCLHKPLALNTLELVGNGESDAKVFDYCMTGDKELLCLDVEKAVFAYNNRDAIFDMLCERAGTQNDEIVLAKLAESLRLVELHSVVYDADICRDFFMKGLLIDKPEEEVNMFWRLVADVVIRLTSINYVDFTVDVELQAYHEEELTMVC